MTKTTYKSRKDGLEIPVFVFEPLKLRGPKGHPAIVWVHPDIRGHVYEYYIPYVREAVSRGYVVVAPEYRGSVGYGQPFYDAIDYGGAEVDDVLTAVDYIKSTMPHVDPARIGIIGWSHGGMITLLSITHEPTTFKAAAALVPVTNLFQRLAWTERPARYHQQIDPANRIRRPAGRQRAGERQRTRNDPPIYQIDKLQIPLLVHITRNDQDVNFEEAQQLVDALKARKSNLAETQDLRQSPGRPPVRSPVPGDDRTQRRSERSGQLHADQHHRATGFVGARLGVPRLQPRPVPRRQRQVYIATSPSSAPSTSAGTSSRWTRCASTSARSVSTTSRRSSRAAT